MKKLNLHFKVILLISTLLISSKNIYSQWTIVGDLAGLSARPTVSVVDGNTAFVTGGSGGSDINATYKTTNGGTNWIQLNTGTFRPFLSIWAIDANNVFAGDNGNAGIEKLYKTTNGGDNWTVIDSAFADVPNITGIKFSNLIPSFGIAVGGAPGANFYTFKTRDEGNTWTKTLVTGFAGINSGIGSLNVIDSLFYAIGSISISPSIIITTDGGVTWNLRNLNLPPGSPNFTGGIAFKEDKLTGIAGLRLPIIARTTDGGLNWVNIDVGNGITSGFAVRMRWIEGTNTCYLNATESTNGGVLKSIDGGLNWTQMTTSGLGISNFDTRTEGINIYGYANSSEGGLVGGTQVLKVIERDSLLPVELSSFVSFVNHRNVKLNWTTSMETNNSGFDIERSDVNRQTSNEWRKIGYVNGNGSTNSPNNYEFTDKNLLSGKYNYRLKQIDYNGNYNYYDLQNEVVIGIPEKYSLSQNYPNPFNPNTMINYQLSMSNFISLKVYDVLGNEVATLVNEKQNAGYYTVDFDARDGHGSNLSSGVYFYKLAVDGNIIDTKRMLLLK